MNENMTPDKSEKEFQAKRTGAMIFAGVVYTGVVIAATMLFISFILTAFPNNAFGSRAVMTLAGLLVGGSMLAFPIALHNWAVSGWHRYVTIGLYYLEMGIIALNTIVAFAALLFKHAGITLPDWIAWYEPFSIGSIVYTLFAWGTVFLLDPHISRRAKDRDNQEKFENKVTQKMSEFLESVEGEDAVMRVAQKKIENAYRPDLSDKKHFGSGASTQTATAPAAQLWECVNCKHVNTGRFCSECGQIAPVAFSTNGKTKANP
jgi:hypothetical protein